MIFLELFITFLKIGAFTFGGGHAMISLIQEQVVAHNWLTNEQVINFIAISESTPGTFAMNLATYVGMEISGFLGAICTTFGEVLPSFIIIIIVVRYFEEFKNNKIIKACMSGIRPAVIGLITSVLVSIGKIVFFPIKISFFTYSFISSLIIFTIVMTLTLKKFNPIIVIIISAILGIIGGYITWNHTELIEICKCWIKSTKWGEDVDFEDYYKKL